MLSMKVSRRANPAVSTVITTRVSIWMPHAAPDPQGAISVSVSLVLGTSMKRSRLCGLALPGCLNGLGADSPVHNTSAYASPVQVQEIHLSIMSLFTLLRSKFRESTYPRCLCLCFSGLSLENPPVRGVEEALRLYQSSKRRGDPYGPVAGRNITALSRRQRPVAQVRTWLFFGKNIIMIVPWKISR